MSPLHSVPPTGQQIGNQEAQWEKQEKTVDVDSWLLNTADVVGSAGFKEMWQCPASCTGAFGSLGPLPTCGHNSFVFILGVWVLPWELFEAGSALAAPPSPWPGPPSLVL